MKPLSLTARISMLFAAAAALVLLAAGLWISRAVEAHFVEEDHQELTGKLELIRHLLAKAHTPSDMDALAQELDDALVGHPNLSVAVVNARGRTWFATTGADFPRPLLRPTHEASGKLEQWIQKGVSYRGMVVRMPVEDTVYTVAVALNITDHLVFMAEFRRILGLAMALAALATAALGWAVTRQGLLPLHEMANTATSIYADRLSQRLPAEGVPEEIRVLAQAFNAMLARLEDAFRRLSDFSSDIAHELRTPVSNLMTQTQVALAKPRSPEEYRELLTSAMEEYERLARMIGDMLFLAQADNRLVVPRRENVDLTLEVARLLEFYEAYAADLEVGLAQEGQARVMGDKLMLQRAVSNLLSNALRHTPRGGTVRVRLSEGDRKVRIAVENPGPGIPPEHLPRVFDRFYRVDPARREGTGEHTGLGLAITKSLVEAHGGEIRVASGNGLTRFEIDLPPAPP